MKPGKTPPADFDEISVDETTGKRMGYEPVEQSGFARWHAEAVQSDEVPGTYELCGPKINGNPEGFGVHVLVRHGVARYQALNCPLGYDELRKALPALKWEGIVWHHPDGRMAKLKKRDFPTEETP